MEQYDYTQDDFKSTSQYDLIDLQNTIYNTGLTTIDHIDATYDGPSSFTLSIYFTTPLTTEEKASLDAIIANYTYVYYENLIATITDSRSAGSNGGTFTAGSWVTRVLNEIQGSQNFCTLSANQFTLVPGTYQINVTTCACGVQNHQFRIYNITDSKSIAVSQNGYTLNSNDSISAVVVVTISTNTTYEIQHRCTKTVADYGFGRGVGFGEDEIYTAVTVRNFTS